MNGKLTSETAEPTKIPNPGSDAALSLGCKCPVLDNGHGRGYLGDARFGFVVRDDCPLHGSPSSRPKFEEPNNAGE